MAVGILTSVQRLWDDIGTHTGELEKLQNIDRIADYAFKNMVPFYWPNAENRDQEIFAAIEFDTVRLSAPQYECGRRRNPFSGTEAGR